MYYGSSQPQSAHSSKICAVSLKNKNLEKMKLDFENGKYCGSRKAWNAKRAEILERAQNKREECGVINPSVGSRNKKGDFVRVCGNLHLDKAGFGELTFKEANEVVKNGFDLFGYEGVFVVVLTISHTDHNPQNNDNDNLRALCQKCHINHDKGHRAKNARVTREKKKGLTNKLAL